MVATLTMLPGTPTPRPPTPWPSRTPRATNTFARVPGFSPTDTPIPPEACPTGSVDTAAPEDPSQLPGRHYDLARLPDAFELQDTGILAEPAGYSWVHVTWQGRSLFWTQKEVCQDDSDKSYWEVADVLALPRLEAQRGEAMSTQCFIGDKSAPLVVAYGIYDPTQPAEPQPGGLRGWPLRIQAAYEIGGQFRPLNPSGLNCVVVELKNP